MKKAVISAFIFGMVSMSAAQSAQPAQKPIKNTSPVAKEQKSEFDLAPVGQWIPMSAGMLGARTPVEIMKLSDTDPDPNPSRWIRITRNKELAVFVDNRTVQKQVQTNGVEHPAGPPVAYLFWEKVMLYEGTNRIVTNAHQHFVNCQTRTLNDDPVEPDTSEEKLFDYFCKSADALNTIVPKTHEQIAKELRQLQRQQAVGN